MANSNRFKTDRRRKLEERDLRIYTEYNTLMTDPEASSGKVTEYLMGKYSIYSPSTVWEIRRRVAKRLGESVPGGRRA